MDLRYAVELGQATDQPCPCPKRFMPRSIVAFRFVSGPFSEYDFVPLILKEQCAPPSPGECRLYALSFFNSVEAAQKKWESLKDRVEAHSRYGNQIAEVEIRPCDGLTEPPSLKTGHFGVHPEKDSTFAMRVRACHRVV